MTTLTQAQLGGFVPAVVTPFNTAGEIMEDAFQSIVGHMLDIGARGICVAGDNGESWTLLPDERIRLTRLAVDKVAGRAPVIVGASAPSAHQVIAYAHAAREAGASAILMMPQTYVLKATRDELLRHFEAVGRAADLPIIAYNSPRRAGFEMSVDDIEAITHVAPIIGLKESSRDFFHHSHVVHRLGGRLAVMTGPSHFILPMAGLGASGFIATGPELLGALAGRLTPLGRAAPGPEYIEAHHRLTRLYELLMGVGTWPSALKAALNLMGLPAGEPRGPVQPLDAKAHEKVRGVLEELRLIGG